MNFLSGANVTATGDKSKKWAQPPEFIAERLPPLPPSGLRYPTWRENARGDSESSFCFGYCLSLRVFDDEGKMWKRSVKDIDGEVLCVSQFTLLANTTKGNKPDFHRAMGAETSKEFYATFLEKMKESYKPEKIKDGKFGAMMNVSLMNEGPVTFTIDSHKFEYVEP
ncbi:D-tyrosyl-tRNA(Tyr) deacylase [Marasmius crinis-equi]|uniref:D-aminoacyl-tRNA deacylase n=1 Tax=Marasmius crinis-equi TaxID=585013 RepID=A0ABR3EZN2_9AGAR